MVMEFLFVIKILFRYSAVLMGSLFNSFSAIKHWFHDQVELQRPHGFLWWPVWLAFGVGFYFLLPFEPVPYYGLILLLAGAAFYHHFRSQFILALCLCALGFCAAQFRTAIVHTPFVEAETGTVEIAGRIVSVEPMDAAGKQVRLLLSDLQIERFEGELPVYVRMSVRSAEPVAELYRAGVQIKGLGSLGMSDGSVFPGGFDFRRHLFFQQIGGVGFFYGAPDVVEEDQPQLIYHSGLFRHWRSVIGERVMEVLPGRSGAMVLALLTGQRGGITDDDMEAMRASGLAHMLAISGLHVGLFSGVVFFAIRLFLVLIPGVGLRFPVKKIAAVIAFSAACFYMMLAGATIPTQRAVLMIGVVFLAVLLDRTALSMRLVSFAAFVVLLVMPESLLSVSFQLSFAAVVALIFVYDLLRGWLSGIYRQAGFFRRAALYVGGVALTSLIAGFATAPFSLYHFQTWAVYGVAANVFAMPVVSFVVMPMAVVALAAMPLGLDYIPLWVMERGVDVVLHVAHGTADIEGSVLRAASLPLAFLVLVTLGGIWIVHVRGKLRWIGLFFCGAAIVMTMQEGRPDVFVGEKHGIWAYRRGDDFFVSSRQKEKFVRKNWERSLGMPEGKAQVFSDDPLLHCDEQACRTELKGQKVSFVMAQEALADECDWADILISRWNEWGDCVGEIAIDYADTLRGGVHAVYIEDSNVEYRSVRSEKSKRPWTF